MDLVFFIEFSKVEVDRRILVKNLTTAGGRWDVVCRSIMAAKAVSESGVPVTFVGIFTNSPSPKILQILPDEWGNWPKTELGVAEELQRRFSLQGKDLLIMTPPALHGAAASYIRQDHPLLLLTETGVPLENISPLIAKASTIQILLGSAEGFGPVLPGWLANRPHHSISIGSRSYLSSQCITLIGCLLSASLPPA